MRVVVEKCRAEVKQRNEQLRRVAVIAVVRQTQDDDSRETRDEREESKRDGMLQVGRWWLGVEGGVWRVWYKVCTATTTRRGREGDYYSLHLYTYKLGFKLETRD